MVSLGYTRLALCLVQLGVNKPTVDIVAAQLQSDSRALRHYLKLHGAFRRKALEYYLQILRSWAVGGLALSRTPDRFGIQWS